MRCLQALAVAGLVLATQPRANLASSRPPPLDFALPLAAQAVGPGRIVEKVECAAAPSQSYALYLPSGYTRDRAWPILYAFDAGARGLVPVERYRDAAERYGLIVAGSNNSRNGPIAIADEALRAMVADTSSRFSVDARRVYLTGFSGGARVAVLAAAALGDRAAGVIGAAAGFPTGLQPTAATPFGYFGTIGVDDFNFPEMRGLDATLAKLGVRHHVEVFEGGHAWPPADVCMRAIEWMEIEAIRSKRRTDDAALVDRILARWTATAEAEEQAGRPVEAWRRYSLLAATFAGLRDVAGPARKARELASSREVRSALAEEEASVARQAAEHARIARLADRAAAGEDGPASLVELLQAVEELRARSERPRSDAARMVARRVLASSWSRLYEATARDLEAGQPARAAARLAVMARMRPDDARVAYSLACALARSGKKKDALDALREAIKRGFRDAAAIAAEQDLAPLRSEPGFRKILEELQSPGQP